MNHVPTKQKLDRSTRRGAAVATALALGLLAMPKPAAAQGMEIGEREPIERQSRPGVSVRPGAYFPSRGSAGLAIDASATYGIPVNPVVIAPGARFAGYFGDNGAISGMPVVEAMLPVGEFVPYVKAGLGVGNAMGPRETSLAFMTGIGMDVHMTRDLLVGVDATYETVAGTGFNTVAIGPHATIRY